MDLKKKPTHFVCASCGKIYEIKHRVIRLTEYTCFSGDSYLKFYANRYHVQLCTKCDKRSPK
jgi:Fe2+ or Zn2+ uptake regulation protein